MSYLGPSWPSCLKINFKPNAQGVTLWSFTVWRTSNGQVFSETADAILTKHDINVTLVTLIENCSTIYILPINWFDAVSEWSGYCKTLKIVLLWIRFFEFQDNLIEMFFGWLSTKSFKPYWLCEKGSHQVASEKGWNNLLY